MVNDAKAKNERLVDLVARQKAIDDELRELGIRDLVGDFGELIAARALGVSREKPVTEGHDIIHPTYGRIQVKTRKSPAAVDGKTARIENRAAGFKAPKTAGETAFDWLMHVVLNSDYSVDKACLVSHSDVWPEIERTTMKVGYNISSTRASSQDWTARLKEAAAQLFVDET